MVTINIGKIAKDKTYTENSSDAGALAGASVASYAFNYVAEANKAGDKKRLEGNYNRFKEAMTKYYNIIEDRHGRLQKAMEAVKNIPPGCCAGMCKAEIGAGIIADGADGIGAVKENPPGKFRNQIYQLIKNADKAVADGKRNQESNELGVIPNYWKLQEDFFIAMRERVNDDNKANDLYQNALSACYRYNLYNSGMPVKMGEDAKEFYEWVDSLTPTRVNNGTPETYNWNDAAGRSHTVTAICSIDNWLSWTVNKTSYNREQVTTTLETTAENFAAQAYKDVKSAQASYATGCAVEPCCPASICKSICDAADEAGDASMTSAMTNLGKAMGEVAIAYIAVTTEGSPKTVSEKKGMKDDIITDIEDINVQRVVNSSNFQFHMGGVVKGPRGDIDTPTFYPPTQSGAAASFAGSGSITEKNPAHDAALISAN